MKEMGTFMLRYAHDLSFAAALPAGAARPAGQTECRARGRAGHWPRCRMDKMPPGDARSPLSRTAYRHYHRNSMANTSATATATSAARRHSRTSRGAAKIATSRAGRKNCRSSMPYAPQDDAGPPPLRFIRD